MKKCPFCAEEIQDEATRCRFCNNELAQRPAQKKTNGCGTAILVAALVVIGFFSIMLVVVNIMNYLDEGKSNPSKTSPGTTSGSVSSPKQNQADPLEKPREPADILGDGIFEVGRDIQPGKYKTTGPATGSPLCYYARLKGLSAEFEDIISNGTSQGPAAVTIKGTDKAFQSTGCSTWMKFGNK